MLFTGCENSESSKNFNQLKSFSAKFSTGLSQYDKSTESTIFRGFSPRHDIGTTYREVFPNPSTFWQGVPDRNVVPRMVKKSSRGKGLQVFHNLHTL